MDFGQMVKLKDVCDCINMWADYMAAGRSWFKETGEPTYMAAGHIWFKETGEPANIAAEETFDTTAIDEMFNEMGVE